MMSEVGEKAMLSSSLMDEIAKASEEQLRTVEQIHIAISQMEDASQASAAISEESAASASELKNQIANLQKVYQNILHLVHGKTH
jgi:methyl-accepting chemotaxis protein